MSLAAVMPGRMCRPPQVPDMYMHCHIAVLNLSSHACLSAHQVGRIWHFVRNSLTQRWRCCGAVTTPCLQCASDSAANGIHRSFTSIVLCE